MVRAATIDVHNGAIGIVEVVRRESRTRLMAQNSGIGVCAGNTKSHDESTIC